MIKKTSGYAAGLTAVQAILIYVWLTDLSPLSGTDTYYSVYLLCGVAALLCLWDNRRSPAPGKDTAAAAVFSALFALAVVLGNYELYEPTSLQNSLNACMDILGGFCVGFQILCCMLRRLPLEGNSGGRNHPARVFFGVFGAVTLIDMVYLLFARYPGILTTDSFSTVAQILEGSYDNTMPFWHTMLVQVFVKTGLALFGDINAAVALFHGFQILLLAGCFAYALVTLYQIGVPRLWLAVVFGIYALLPYNIVYSVTMWKDVPFAASALLMATAFYRLLKDVGDSRKGSTAVFALGALGFSLMRTNGWYALLAVALLLTVSLRKGYRSLLVLLLSVLAVAWVMINPLLSILKVPGTNMVEAFAVPMQQVARVAANERELTDTQRQMLSEIFVMDKLGQLYDPQTVDPVKFETFRYDRTDHIRQNAKEYLKLYLELGGQYPADYLKAWIDETKGYWNGGYDFWIYTLDLGRNPLGIVHTGGENRIARLYAAWFRFLEKPAALQPLYSIGLHVWILVACCLVNGLKRRREWLIAVPALVLTVGLWLGTPVFAEFRYAYPMILTAPLVLLTTVYAPKER